MGLETLVVYLAVIVIAVLLVWFLLSQLTLPDPIRQIITIVLVVVVGVMAILFLLRFARADTVATIPPPSVHHHLT